MSNKLLNSNSIQENCLSQLLQLSKMQFNSKMQIERSYSIIILNQKWLEFMHSELVSLSLHTASGFLSKRRASSCQKRRETSKLRKVKSRFLTQGLRGKKLANLS